MLDAAADDGVVDAGGDQRGAEVDGLLGGAALAVDGRGRGLDRAGPASSQALRPMLTPCSPNCWTQPATTSSTSLGSIPVRSKTSE